MRIDSPKVSNLTFQTGSAVADSSFTGSFSGSFTGVGNFTGLIADSVEYANVTNKPAGLVSGSASQARTQIGTVIGTDVQAFHSNLDDISNLNPTDSTFIVGAGSSFVAEDGATARTSLGLGSLAVLNTDSALNSIDLSNNPSVSFANLTNKPTLISQSAQITITESQISDLSHYSDSDADARIAAASVTDLTDVTGAGSGIIISTAERTKLTGIETSADVTDTENVTAAGALMDSEVTNLADVKAFDPADYATAAQGNTADSAQQPPAEGAFVDGDKTKLDGIEANADVTDTENVTAAGALMDSEVDADIKTLSLPANTTISTFGKSLVDDADAAAARSTLGVDAAGTDNSTDVTLGGSLDYITISGQIITRNAINLATDVIGTLPVGNMSATALTTVQTAANQSAHLALTAQEGDVVVRTDENKTYMHNGGTAGTMADYTLLATPTDAVTSVNGNTGVVTVVENVTTNLGITGTTGDRTITSSDGTDAVIPVATDSVSGVMSAADHTKLSGIESNATADQTAGEIKTAYESNDDTNVFTDAEKTKLGTVASNANNYSLPEATATVRGGIELFSNTAQSVAANAVTTTASRTYGLQLNSAGQAVVNVPWVDTNTDTNTVTSVGISGDLSTGNITLVGAGATSVTKSGGTVTITSTDTNTNTFRTVTAGGNTLGSSETLAFTAGTNVTITESAGAVTISSTDTNTTYTRASFINQDVNTTDNVHFEGLMVGQTTGATANTIRCTGDVVAYYSSDKQFKDNIVTLDGALDKVKAIRGVRFDWNDKQDVYEGHDIGVVAQEVEAVLPELVHYREHNNSKAVDYVKLTAVLIEAVKELSAKVDALENK